MLVYNILLNNVPLLKNIMSIELPYGKSIISADAFPGINIDEYYPKENTISLKRQKKLVMCAIKIGFLDFKKNCPVLKHSSIAIVVNDPTRPTPHDLLLPPLLDYLILIGGKTENISIFIATGTHKGLTNKEISGIIKNDIFKTYRTHVHNCDDELNLKYLGESAAGTPIYVNKSFFSHDVKIVIGQIEPHHFMGYSGGVKSAAIGLGGRKTITANHKMLMHPLAKMGNFYNNPMRIDIENIGNLIGVDLALNVVLNSSKQIISVFFGEPYSVMEQGIKISQDFCRVNTDTKYDLIFCSPGGYPKDINLYQAQKALTHASTFLRKGGVIIIAAECVEGLGNKKFKDFFEGKKSPEHVISAFESQSFSIGPHKAFQLALQAKDFKIILISKLDPNIVEKLFLTPSKSLKEAVKIAENFLPINPKIAVLPSATYVMNK